MRALLRCAARHGEFVRGGRILNLAPAIHPARCPHGGCSHGGYSHRVCRMPSLADPGYKESTVLFYRTLDLPNEVARRLKVPEQRDLNRRANPEVAAFRGARRWESQVHPLPWRPNCLN